MNKLALSLAASAALIPAATSANDQTVDPPKRWEDVPNVQMRTPVPPPGTTWSAPPPVVRQAPRAAPPPPPPAVVRQSAPSLAAPPPPVIHRVERVQAAPPAVHHAPPQHHAPPVHHAPTHAGAHGGHGKMMHERHDRVVVHHGSDRVKQYPLEAHPGAYRDGPYPMEWGRHGWERDEDGVPVYVGDGDYYPDDEDYAYVEGHGDGYHGYGYAQPGGWYGHSGTYGGYGYWGWPTVTITETTVTHHEKVCCTKVTYAPKKVVKRRYKSQPRG